MKDTPHHLPFGWALWNWIEQTLYQWLSIHVYPTVHCYLQSSSLFFLCFGIREKGAESKSDASLYGCSFPAYVMLMLNIYVAPQHITLHCWDTTTSTTTVTTLNTYAAVGWYGIYPLSTYAWIGLNMWHNQKRPHQRPKDQIKATMTRDKDGMCGCVDVIMAGRERNIGRRCAVAV